MLNRDQCTSLSSYNVYCENYFEHVLWKLLWAYFVILDNQNYVIISLLHYNAISLAFVQLIL